MKTMIRTHKIFDRSFFAALLAVFCFGAIAMGQTPTPTPEKEEAQNPFALDLGKPLPPGMTGSNPNDPRSKLKAGMDDAGVAALGIRHVSLLPKPQAFQLGTTDVKSDRVRQTLGSLGVADPSMLPPTSALSFAALAFANSDIAFQGNRLFMGNFYGMNIYDISDPAKTKLLTSMVCPGGQGDVSVYKNLMFMSVEMPNGRLDCGEQGFAANLPPVQKDRFRGVRIFDISDISSPKQVAAVQTCRGSHTHTLVTDPKDANNIYVYVSGTSFVRPAGELEGCSGAPPEKDPNTSLFRIEVIKVPLAAPQDAAIVSTPRIFGDPETGKINVLDDGGSHSNQGRPSETNQCHDITAYPEIGLAAGACAGNGIILDIRDPANPKRIEAVNDPNYAYWHSAAFSNDGSKVVFTDEWGGGMGPRCRADDPNVWGANAIFRLNDGKLSFESYYKLPAAQSAAENCVAHNGSLVPVPGRDIKIQAWYQGGISLMDFTDPAKPVEIAYFDRGPINEKMLIMGGHWSAYWYNGYIYGSEIARGLDIFELTPTKDLTLNEIDASKAVRLDILNVQTQERMEWPNKLVIAKAYLDQLERSNAMPAPRIAAIRTAVQSAERSKLGRSDRAKLRGLSAEIGKAAAAASGDDAARMKALAEVLNNPVL
jgi:hypothetical protein